jgi:hypothetical protein
MILLPSDSYFTPYAAVRIPGTTSYDQFESYVSSSFYHVYDDTLIGLIEQFRIAWRDVCQYSDAFTPTNVPDKLRPATWMDLAINEEVSNAVEQVPAAARKLHKSLQELLKYIRNNYLDII